MYFLVMDRCRFKIKCIIGYKILITFIYIKYVKKINYITFFIFVITFLLTSANF